MEDSTSPEFCNLKNGVMLLNANVSSLVFCVTLGIWKVYLS